MFPNRKSIGRIAGAAVVAAALSIAPVHAKPIATDAAKEAASNTPQKLADARTPYFFLVLGVGY
jgi:hypothetical protein